MRRQVCPHSLEVKVGNGNPYRGPFAEECIRPSRGHPLGVGRINRLGKSKRYQLFYLLWVQIVRGDDPALGHGYTSDDSTADSLRLGGDTIVLG